MMSLAVLEKPLDAFIVWLTATITGISCCSAEMDCSPSGLS